MSGTPSSTFARPAPRAVARSPSPGARRAATSAIQATLTAQLQANARDTEARALRRFVGALALSIAVILATLILGWIAIRGPLRRLRQLEEHARRIGAGEVDLPPLAVTGADETALLAHAFDDMSEILRQAKGQLDQLASGDEFPDVDGHRGMRHTSGRRYSFDDPESIVIVVSEDGPVTMMRNGVILGRTDAQA